MREDLLQEIEQDYARIRGENEREEARRKEIIRREQPEIQALVLRREELIYGSLRSILKGKGSEEDLPREMEQISASIRAALAAKGYPEDYLAPVYRCAECRDTGKTGEPVRQDCKCLRRMYQQKLREKIGLSAESRETFDTFDLSVFSEEPLPGRSFSQRDLMRKCRDDCEDWANRYPDASCRDLVLTGKSGLGKTFLLRAMAERLIERGINVLIISAYRLIDAARRNYFSGDPELDEIMEAEVLMIDDLGSEPLMQNVTVEQLFNLINERQNRGLATVISTNLSISEFRTRYTERIASRIMDRRTCRVTALEGKDIRTGSGAKR